jgi:hypothetical protein
VRFPVHGPGRIRRAIRLAWIGEVVASSVPEVEDGSPPSSNVADAVIFIRAGVAEFPDAYLVGRMEVVSRWRTGTQCR